MVVFPFKNWNQGLRRRTHTIAEFFYLLHSQLKTERGSDTTLLKNKKITQEDKGIGVQNETFILLQ